MKKILFIPKSHAQRIACGLSRVVHSDVPLAPYERVYLYATAQVFNINQPIEWLQEEINQMNFGNLTDDGVYGAIIGFADVVGECDPEVEIWTHGMQQPLYLLDNVHVFDEPLALNDMDEPLEAIETFLPSHMREPARPMESNDGDELLIPVSELIFRNVNVDKYLDLELTWEMQCLVSERDGSLKEYRYLTLVCGNRRKTYCWTARTAILWDIDMDTKEAYLFPSCTSPTGRGPRGFLHLDCSIPLTLRFSLMSNC